MDQQTRRQQPQIGARPNLPVPAHGPATSNRMPQPGGSRKNKKCTNEPENTQANDATTASQTIDQKRDPSWRPNSTPRVQQPGEMESNPANPAVATRMMVDMPEYRPNTGEPLQQSLLNNKKRQLEKRHG